MKTTINGTRYNTNTCEILGDYDHTNNGNYSGTSRLLLAPDGNLLVWCDGNGQDCYLSDYLILFINSHFKIDDFELDEKEEARCVELGLIKIA